MDHKQIKSSYLKFITLYQLKITLKDFDRLDKLEMLGIVIVNTKHVSKKKKLSQIMLKIEG